ncbi:HK97 gp10 family phage protein [Vagococcus carniphilus]|uniref:HK97 gp10 family phage protein n=1 Tax=Vagococcus carniphilus TaxID=218144 RepID=UPI00288CB0DD|nr:HK97 gp10 family phage protein [Vagococcus carniphilus]MDT2832251.1 HK97 gp10 family phage protein [Vagococcus carniphilus]MDT2840755.1 HK97 gp10 family phage protein [Vagococcus carniphilus]MDT2855724.1 HK97 gp10 family phage protein [Vagococcus carniphilus]
MAKQGYSMSSNADKVIENFKKWTPLAEQEGIAMVNDSLGKVLELIVPLTPIDTGDLRRGYRIVKARKLSSGRIVGAIINNEKYFKYVNDGHRTKNGGFKRGRFMLQKSSNLAHMTYIPRRFKQMAIVIAKKG